MIPKKAELTGAESRVMLPGPGGVECLCPPKFICLNPIPSVMVLGGGAFGGDEVMGVDPW